MSVKKEEIMDVKCIQGDKTPATIIAVDNGNGNTKTEHLHFKSGVDVYMQEPTLNKDYFLIDGKYYVVGESHMTYQGDKTNSDECYILTMAAITMELEYRQMTTAQIILSVGLPLGWCGKDKKEELKTYMLRSRSVDVMHHDMNYHFEIVDVDVYPQGFAAICGRYAMNGTNMIADIGNGTINMMQIKDGIPKESSIYTEKMGVAKCVDDIRKELSEMYADDVPEDMFESYLINGTAGKTGKVVDVVRRIAGSYSEEVIKRIYSYGFKEDLMTLYIIGGGGRILKNFSEFWKIPRVIFIDDICANAKGFALLSSQKIQRTK